jgi:uncharacterized protein (UPF0335 family)
MTNRGGVAADQLRALVERIERLAEEKAAIADDIKQVYAEAKANGYDTKILRMVIRLRKQDAAERQEQEALLDLYMHALGMIVEEEIERVEIETGQTDVEGYAKRAAEPSARADDDPAPEPASVAVRRSAELGYGNAEPAGDPPARTSTKRKGG